MNGLNYFIQDHLAIQNRWSIDQAQNFALQAKRILKNRRLLMSNMNRWQEIEVKSPIIQNDARTQENKLKPIDLKGTEKVKLSKDLKCNEIGYKSNDCPSKKFVSMS